MRSSVKVAALLGTVLTVWWPTLAAADKPPLVPVNPPREPETAEEIAAVQTILAAGKMERRAKIAELKGYIASGQHLHALSANSSIQRLSKGKGVYLPSLSRRLSVGEIGVLRQHVPFCAAAQPVKAFQVMDEDTLLIEIAYSRSDRMICWLDGFSTNGVVDGDRHSGVAALLRVTGTRQYGTAIGGSRTVFVLEPFGLDVDPSESQPAERRRSRQRSTVRRNQAEAPRLWTDNTGRFQVTAVFVSLTGGNVKLRKSDGNEITLPLERLSREDRDWISALR